MIAVFAVVSYQNDGEETEPLSDQPEFLYQSA